MDFLNAIILLLNYIFVPALTYGSQLALGAIFVTLIYGILRFANFATVNHRLKLVQKYNLKVI